MIFEVKVQHLMLSVQQIFRGNMAHFFEAEKQLKNQGHTATRVKSYSTKIEAAIQQFVNVMLA